MRRAFCLFLVLLTVPFRIALLPVAFVISFVMTCSSYMSCRNKFEWFSPLDMMWVGLKYMWNVAGTRADEIERLFPDQQDKSSRDTYLRPVE